MITYIKLMLLYPFVMPSFNFFFKQLGILIGLGSPLIKQASVK